MFSDFMWKTKFAPGNVEMTQIFNFLSVTLTIKHGFKI